MKPTVLVAAGCSWVAGRAIDTNPTATEFDFTHVEDPAFVQTHSFAGLLKNKLGLNEFVMLAKNGTNNEEQIQSITNFIAKEQGNYSNVFVLFGVTTPYRWQMYSASVDAVVPCSLGMDRKNQPSLDEEFKYYTKHFFSKDFEESRLATQLLMLDGYLTNLNIKHLFFNSFYSYNVNVDRQSYYRVNERDNDILKLLCVRNGVGGPRSSMPFLNQFGKTQYLPREVTELQKLGMLDLATAHPTVVAHKLIADELYSYIEG